MSAEAANTAIIKALDKLINDSMHDYVVYRPSFVKITGSITAAIFLERVRYHWIQKGKQPFYKFNAPCEHDLYNEKDSWQEQLGFTRGEFEGVQKRIGTRIMKGDKKSDALVVFDDKGELLPITSLVIYWRDAKNVMWYEFNEPLFRAYLIKQANAEITNSQILHYLVSQDSSIRYVMQKSSDTFISGESSESLSEIKEKDSSSLPEEAAPIIPSADSDSHNPVEESELETPVEGPVSESLEPEAITAPVFEESASQELAPESSEILPVEEVPDAEVAGVIEEAEELVKANKVALDNCYNEIVRRAFAPIGKPLNFSGVVTNHSKFLRGLFREGDDGAGPERLKYQLAESPMLPAEIAGMTLWARQECGLKQLPKTCSTLRERCDEFRALFDYKQWVEKGQKVVEQIMAGLNGNLEDSGHNNHRRPTEADYAAPNTPLPTNALSRLKEMATVPKVKP